jgi:hypothetical protein
MGPRMSHETLAVSCWVGKFEDARERIPTTTYTNAMQKNMLNLYVPVILLNAQISVVRGTHTE